MQGRRLVLASVIKANTLGILLTTFVLYYIEEGDISRSMLIMFYCINIFLDFSARMAVYYILRNMRKKGSESETGAACGI